MNDKLTDMRNIRFMLYEVLDAEGLTKFKKYEDHSRETFDMALNTAYKLAREVFWPAYQTMDRKGVNLENGMTKVAEEMHEIWRQCKEGGWFAPTVAYEDGGQQFPELVYTAALFLFHAANSPAAMYVGGATGAASLIGAFGSRQLKDLYLPKLYGGEWGGSMAMTEPHAGSSLSDITTSAVKAADGDHYLIKGVKRFISSGDHDLCENIVHLVLVRIDGAPPGVKGISLFTVPKYRPNPDGAKGTFNDVVTAGLEHKMGLKGNATVTLNLGENGDCHGWLLGDENQGLAYMFLLMNAARIHTGMQACSAASTAFQCALEYCRERLQGRDIGNKDLSTPQIPIIEHPDVRLMLLRQKAFVEGGIGLILYGAKLMDLMHNSEARGERERSRLILEVLTPCIKAHLSDGAFESIAIAVQCCGGAGFIEEFPLAQLLRDCKVYSIYEGANGIQALDLLGRKVVKDNGAAVRALMAAVGETLAAAKDAEPLRDITEKFQKLHDAVVAVTMHLASIGMSGNVHLYVANATPYLEMFSQMAMLWQMLEQALVAQKALDSGTDEGDFYTSKIATIRFYANTVVPHALATAEIIESDERTSLDFQEAWF